VPVVYVFGTSAHRAGACPQHGQARLGSTRSVPMIVIGVEATGDAFPVLHVASSRPCRLPYGQWSWSSPSALRARVGPTASSSCRPASLEVGGSPHRSHSARSTPCHCGVMAPDLFNLSGQARARPRKSRRVSLPRPALIPGRPLARRSPLASPVGPVLVNKSAPSGGVHRSRNRSIAAERSYSSPSGQ